MSIPGPPPEPRKVATYQQWDWLFRSVERLVMRMETVVASLTDVLGLLEANKTAEDAQTAEINALGDSVTALIALVTELRTTLSPQEQAQVDQITAAVQNRISSAQAQSAKLDEIADAVAAARSTSTSGTGGTPPPTP